MAEDTTVSRLAELEADNARLRRLLDERDAPGELRHRLRNMLAMLRAIIRDSAETRDDIESYVAHLEDRLDALVRAQNAADRGGEVDLHALIADELYHYKAAEEEQVRLAGPTVFLQPRAAQVLALAMHELAVNAVEHGPLMAVGGRVEVEWQVATTESDVLMTLTWKETGMELPVEQRRRGFGSRVLHETMRYELKAETALQFEPDGLRYRVRFPLISQFGRLGTPS